MTATALTLEHQARAQIALGPRVLAELLAEVEAVGMPCLRERLVRYCGLDPRVLRAPGADRFPPRFAAIDGGGR
jgi:hypothetical protein